MFCIGDVSVCAVADFAIGGDQAVFVFAAVLRLLSVRVGTRVEERRPELSSMDLPFCRRAIPGIAHALFGNHLRRRGWTLWAAIFSPQEMASETNQRMDRVPGWRSGNLRFSLRISNF